MFSFAIFFTIFFLSFFFFQFRVVCFSALLCLHGIVVIFFIYLHKNENPDSAVVVAASVFSSFIRELWQLCCCWVL
jgi:hypothetical protein